MPGLPGVPSFDELVRRWLDLAERRRAHFSDLYRGGRWRRYYTPEQFAERVTDMRKAVTAWGKLAGKPPEERPQRRRHGPHRMKFTILLLLSGAILVQQAVAQNIKRGEQLLTDACGSCHAISGAESPAKDAPAFSTLGRRYPVEALEEALAEGIVSGHPDMPETKFDADDVGAIIAYLRSIQR